MLCLWNGWHKRHNNIIHIFIYIYILYVLYMQETTVHEQIFLTQVVVNMALEQIDI